MEIRKTRVEDLNRVQEILDDAKMSLKNANVNQWQDGYPNVDKIEQDIELDCSYVVCDKEKVVGTAFITRELEPTYNHIEEGKWLSNESYYVIHRIAIDSNYKGKGVSSKFIEFTKDLCRVNDIHSIKIDTHPDNLRMQGFLKKEGFVYCGKIYLEDGDLRFAYELRLD